MQRHQAWLAHCAYQPILWSEKPALRGEPNNNKKPEVKPCTLEKQSKKSLGEKPNFMIARFLLNAGELLAHLIGWRPSSTSL